MKKNNKKGFTLIELLIVVAIIGILAAIAIPQFGAYRARAVRTSMVADAKNISLGVETMFQDCNSYSPVNGLSFVGPAQGNLIVTAASCTASPTASYPVRASKGNTVAATASASTYTISVTNTSGDDSAYTGPVLKDNTGACVWTVGGSC